MNTRTITARYVFPVDVPPLPGGVIRIQNNKIAGVLPHGRITPDLDLGNVAILPGLVNAHTHLDLSDMHGRCPPTPDFTQWLRGVIAFRRQQPPESVQQAIAAGIAASVAAGTTLVGDISSAGASWQSIAKFRM